MPKVLQIVLAAQRAKVKPLQMQELGTVQEPAYVTDEYKVAVKTGRTLITQCNVEGHSSFYLLNLYGWTNGHSDKKIGARTNDPLRVGLRELEALPPLPKMVNADINADSDELLAYVCWHGHLSPLAVYPVCNLNIGDNMNTLTWGGPETDDQSPLTQQTQRHRDVDIVPSVVTY